MTSHCPENKVHGANMGPTWVLSAPGEPHVDPMNLAIKVEISFLQNLAQYSVLSQVSLINILQTSILAGERELASFIPNLMLPLIGHGLRLWLNI